MGHAIQINRSIAAGMQTDGPCHDMPPDMPPTKPRADGRLINKMDQPMDLHQGHLNKRPARWSNNKYGQHLEETYHTTSTGDLSHQQVELMYCQHQPQRLINKMDQIITSTKVDTSAKVDGQHNKWRHGHDMPASKRATNGQHLLYQQLIIWQHHAGATNMNGAMHTTSTTSSTSK